MAELRRRYVKRLTESMVSQILNRESSYEEDFFMRSEETDELLHVCRKENGSINVVFYNRYTNEMCFEDYDNNGKFIKRGVL